MKLIFMFSLYMNILSAFIFVVRYFLLAELCKNCVWKKYDSAHQFYRLVDESSKFNCKDIFYFYVAAVDHYCNDFAILQHRGRGSQLRLLGYFIDITFYIFILCTLTSSIIYFNKFNDRNFFIYRSMIGTFLSL